MQHAKLALAIAAAAFAATSRAAAQDSTHPSVDEASAASVDVPSRGPMRSEPWLHDRLYVRFSTGFGAFNERIDRPGQESHVSVNGIAHTADIAVGTTIQPGVVIGAGFWTSTVLASSTRAFDGEVTMSSAAQNPTSWVAGPWLDYYFDPRRGLHIPAALGVAVINGFDVEGPRLSRNNDAWGAGLLVGLGYEWWISEQWSLGVLGRATAIAAMNKSEDGRSWFHLAGTAPSILLSATYN
jgi:hypothetical protein